MISIIVIHDGWEILTIVEIVWFQSELQIYIEYHFILFIFYKSLFEMESLL